MSSSFSRHSPPQTFWLVNRKKAPAWLIMHHFLHGQNPSAVSQNGYRSILWKYLCDLCPALVEIFNPEMFISWIIQKEGVFSYTRMQTTLDFSCSGLLQVWFGFSSLTTTWRQNPKQAHFSHLDYMLPLPLVTQKNWFMLFFFPRFFQNLPAAQRLWLSPPLCQKCQI